MTTTSCNDARQTFALDALISDVAAAMPGRCLTGAAICAQHAGTLTGLAPQPPDLVAFPETASDVQCVVKLARVHGCPIIPFGAGTSLEGQANAPRGGLSLDLSRMTRILRVGADDLDVTVEAGVTLDQLNAALRDTGLFFPVDPGAGTATLGGMASTRASGTTTVRYGTMRENVLAMKVVLADGTLISTGTRARKSAAGYDLTHLFVGAEGTLGVIVELTLRLQPRPDGVLAGVAAFPTIGAAAHATIAAVQSGIALQRIELIDTAMLRIVNAQSAAGLPEDGPVLFVEIAGTQKAAAEHLAQFIEIAKGEHGRWLGQAAGEDERRALWRARHDAFWSVRSAFPGRDFLVTDVCVPVSRLAECLEETVADLAASRLDGPIVGHVGDGNFHTVLAFDGADGEVRARVDGYLDRLVARAHRMEGTCTGEHGIGQGKAKYLAAEAGPALAVMRQVKAALDPSNLMNPGKMF
ncbi:MAG: FAD-binding oxidoreductase [Hyphomicrobium sp. 32-62-53]|nr:MAG: FAD-binding oxidoreductase [Hyphomicrobium sp. 12-62-95]OYY00445.1 MAG: FAD-binding oxidoreductase [Hyphomicrobium sp. 32-62-53]